MTALALSSSATAATVTVCASGCTSTTIQGGIDAASTGDTVAVSAGTYAENVVVDRPVTLQGAGQGATIVRPASSNPVCAGGSLCGGAASSIVLVQASNVSISDLTLDGDNPALTSGVVTGGADLDARNGIITNHRAGVYENLAVTNVTVENVYLRGIYASSGGSFAFDHDSVANVQGEYASIAIFNLGGSGVVSNSSVSAANDAISSNWSTGTRYVGNRVTGSASGIHTDNNGGFGGTGDVIEGNTVSSCTADGYGIWVFVPRSAPVIRSNRVNGCSVGLGLGAGDVDAPLRRDRGQRSRSRRRSRHDRRRDERLVGLQGGPEPARLRHRDGHRGVHAVADVALGRQSLTPNI